MTQVIIEIKNLVKKLPCESLILINICIQHRVWGNFKAKTSKFFKRASGQISFRILMSNKAPKSSSKDDYGLPLGSEKPKSKIQYDPSLGSHKIEISSSSTSTGPTIASLRPNYQNPTKSQYSLAHILANPIPRPTNPLPITTAHELSNYPYIEKPKLLPIMTLESYIIKEDLKTLIAHIFPKTFYYLPNNPLKTQRFYEFILVDTDSAEITHTGDDQGSVLFSKMKIINILSPQDSNQHLFDSKTFSR
ncbi:hypothetical protein CR513_53112, partial [Mucuna pruriens]